MPEGDERRAGTCGAPAFSDPLARKDRTRSAFSTGAAIWWVDRLRNPVFHTLHSNRRAAKVRR